MRGKLSPMPVLTTFPGGKVYGPYVRAFKRGSQPRRQVVIKYDDGRTTSKAYARWLVEQTEGRVLDPATEHVDHRDDDALNDDLANLQVLTPADNNRKSAKPAKTYEFNCPVCGDLTVKPLRFVKHNWARGSAGPFCGHRCARLHQLNPGGVSKQVYEAGPNPAGETLAGSNPAAPTGAVQVSPCPICGSTRTMASCLLCGGTTRPYGPGGGRWCSGCHGCSECKPL